MHQPLVAIDVISKAAQRPNRPVMDGIALGFFGLAFGLPALWGVFRLARGAVRRRRLRHNFPT